MVLDRISNAMLLPDVHFNLFSVMKFVYSKIGDILYGIYWFFFYKRIYWILIYHEYLGIHIFFNVPFFVTS
jgi:hypothetical protein